MESGGVTLASLLRGEGIYSFASLPLFRAPVIKERLTARVPEARAAVFMVIPYLVRDDGPCNICLYARSRDYHLYARELNGRIGAFFAECGGSGVLFADVSPFDEVEAAVRAGLGVRGANGLLITERYGSYVFIAGLLTTLDQTALEREGVPRGYPLDASCLRCRACLDACPGSCAGTPFRDTCVSSLTQKKGTLTEAEIALVRAGEYVWGCDVCQTVCPMNASAQETPIPFFREKRVTFLTPDSLAEMTDAEFAERAFSWRGKAVLERNLKLRDPD